MTDTCAAISTAIGKAGISVIRISGDEAVSIADRIFKTANGKKLFETDANKAVFGTVYDKNGEKIDTGLVTVFKAPRSYTGEDTVEISCHGSVVGTSLVLGAILDAGARHALPGEFTKRAFINGKLDLTQAEAVADLLDAENADQLRMFSAQLEGGLGKKIKACSEKITEMLAAVYAYIDYPDEDMSDMSDDELEAAINEVKAEVKKLCSSYASGSAVAKGVATAIVGAPNTGKSTFFNLLAGFDRAIVTDIAGTTRDVITESVNVAGIKLLISDTAGIRETEDTVEKIGVERSKNAIDECELCIAVFDGSRKMSDDDISFAKVTSLLAKNKNVVAIINKTDIADKKQLSETENILAEAGFSNILLMSAEKGDGKADFEKIISGFYPEAQNGIQSGVIITNARQYAAVSKAYDSLERALTAMKTLTRDMAGLDLEEALKALCEADGREVSEQIVSTIFSRFCVGK